MAIQTMLLPFAAKSTILLFLVSSGQMKIATGSAIGVESKTSIPEDETMAPWQNCEVFMAPTNTSTGWGVFANRDFGPGELVDITPVHFYMKTYDQLFPEENRLIKSTSLDDYVYGVNYEHLNKYESNVLFGYEMIYNHHPTASNLRLAVSRSGYLHGFYTKKSIRAGEEILSNYGSKDGGKLWFEARNLTMNTDAPITIDSPERLDFLRSQYCTKIYAGAGPQTHQRLFPTLDESRVAPFEAGLFDARAKFPIKAGELIEQAPAMLLFKPFVRDTALGPLVITWEDLLPEHQDSIMAAADLIGGKLPIQYRGPDPQGERVLRMTNVKNVAIFPFAGRIGTVRRLDMSSPFLPVKSNCRLKINLQVHEGEASDENSKPRVSVLLELIATKDIGTGQVLMMDLKPTGTAYERELLKAKLQAIGHSFVLD